MKQTVEEFSEKLEKEFQVDIFEIKEDPRYPLLCVNGDLNFGIFFDPETRRLNGERVCICNARADDFCICDLD